MYYVFMIKNGSISEILDPDLKIMCTVLLSTSGPNKFHHSTMGSTDVFRLYVFLTESVLFLPLSFL